MKEKYQLEWENIVITYINQGMNKSDAKCRADEALQYKYERNEE